ncbi:uncharacterized protein LOC132940637 [Metopolophium dirhodum]|uniref:uncharacterized protein LOC132940637 n=1 Tax=Metopolophium dirhodum TaxID=44670 RepID=UPI00298FF3A1|nr:uncharacterized protein LOC132940637 [Metopolophium dirhodum]
MNGIEPKSITSCIRCSVHSLQLCVLHGLKNAPITSCIIEARKVVKKLRTPKYASWLKRKHLKYAVIDIETRWNFLYNMIYRLLELKEFCKLHDGTNPDVRLRDCEWESIQSVVNALNPAKTATLALQKQDLNLGDFYGIWLKAIHGLTADGSILAKTIKIAMEKELKEKYLENSKFLAAIYVDPRYQCLLTHDQQDLAINRLVETWETLQLLKDKNPELNRSNSSLDAAVHNEVDTSGQHSEDFFENFLSSQSSNLSQSSTSSNPTQTITAILNYFKNVQRIPYTDILMKYWENQKESHAEIYELACVLLAIPATQVSVERSFSGLKFIVSDLRASLDEELLEAIMVIRCNEQFKKYLVQHLRITDPEKRLNFISWFMVTSEDDPLLINRILWTDESKFTNNGILNKQNNRYWSNENPHWAVTTNFQTCWGTNVWVGLIGDIRKNIYYQQNGAPAHNARIVQEFLRVRFGEKCIATHGPVEWPPRSPDLTPLDFFCGDT